MILLLNLTWCSSLAAEYCTQDEQQNTVGCSLMVSAGDPTDPVIVFAVRNQNETREWRLGVRILSKEQLMLNGDAQISVNGGQTISLEHIVSRRAEVTKERLSESASYVISEDLVRTIAQTKDEVLFQFSADITGPIEIPVGANKLSELDALLAEAEEKL
jgi:hypothetical protein